PDASGNEHPMGRCAGILRLAYSARTKGWEARRDGALPSSLRSRMELCCRHRRPRRRWENACGEERHSYGCLSVGVHMAAATYGFRIVLAVSSVASVQAKWKKVPLKADQAVEAAKNDGWIKQSRLYLSETAPDKKFADGAVRLRYRWEKDASILLGLRRQPGT